jgi:hypothetical protein
LALGVWGNGEASISVTKNLSSIQFTCATGSIQGPIALSKQGTFSIAGKYNRLSGPATINEKFNRPFDANYTGKVVGDLLTLIVQVDSLDIKDLTFILNYGDERIVPICP